jgi:hypothetical protein
VARPIRDRLKTAAELLETAGHDDYAADIRAVLAPAGWTLLRSEPGTGSKDVNVPMGIRSSLKASLVMAADEIGVSLSAVARDGLRAVVEGRWMPPQKLTDRTVSRGKPDPLKNLNVRVPEDLRDQVRSMLPELTERAGYRVTVSSILVPWLAEELGVDVPTAEDSEGLKLLMPKRLRDFFVQQAEERELPLQDLMESGIRDLLAGKRSPRPPEWLTVSERPREGGVWRVDPSRGPRKPVPVAKLTVRVSPDLLSGLRDWCAAQTSEWPFHSGMVGSAILKDRLGEPPAE